MSMWWPCGFSNLCSSFHISSSSCFATYPRISSRGLFSEILLPSDMTFFRRGFAVQFSSFTSIQGRIVSMQA